MDLKKAYEMMELSKGATFKELEDKFFILIKRQNTNTAENDEQAEKDHNLLNEAYEIVKKDILGEEETTESKRPIKDKIDHIIYHYKFHIIGGIFLILILGSFVSTLINSQVDKAKQIPPSITVVMLGNYIGDDTSLLEENLASLFPEWEYIKLEFLSNPDQENKQTQQGYGNVIKNQVILANAKPDILIVDQKHFDSYVSNGSFLPLEDHISDQKIGQLAEDQLRYSPTEDDPKEKLYGIEITDNAIFNDVDISGEKIVVIRRGAEEKDNAITFIDKVIE
ncbi:hypothetical protein NC661_11890 [Aquibacillus koreensis]|uniref:J domain-containing protein n=1 Tax=Aquibacillus koreensis TaxID=279446 RepID=A0A9X3WJX4_9BACI|nr:hypothetical protein [Aquibacillus koreensis]MCT2535211.1 hypothetical protein [Aquibacillus koreensis]MDC3421070.1 hypothetical protein [Aquibacillus koreensis]